MLKKHIFFYSLFFLGILLVFFMPGVPWTVDNGLKYLALSTGENCFDIDISGYRNCQLENIPFVKPFVFVGKKHLYTVFSPGFIFIASLIKNYQIIIIFTYLIYCLLSLVIYVKIEKLSFFHKLTLLSPLLFYSFTLWEVTLTSLFLFWSYHLFEKEKHFYAILFLIFTCLFRIEMIFMFLFYLYLYFSEKRSLKFKIQFKMIFVGFFSILLVLSFQYFYYLKTGTFTSYNFSNHKIYNHEVLQVIKNIHYMIFSTGKSLFLNICAYSLLVLLFLNKMILKLKRLNFILLGLLLLIVIISWINYIFFQNNQLHNITTQNSLLITCPLLLLFFQKFNKKAYSLLVILGLMTVFSPEFTGVHWSARFLLPALPVLIYLLTKDYKLDRIFKILVILTIIIQSYSVYLLYKRKVIQYDAQNYILKNVDKVILTDNWWFSADYPLVYKQKKVLLINDLKSLKRFLAKSDIDEFMLATNNPANSGIISFIIGKNLKYADILEVKNFDLCNVYLSFQTKQSLMKILESYDGNL